MISALFIADKHAGQQTAVSSITVEKGKGIVDDRNFAQQRWPGQNITLISQQQIEYFNLHYQQNIALNATRRNIICTDINLNQLVGKEFSIGDVKLKGIELCQPCKTLAKLLANDNLTEKDVIDALLNRSGLRADVLSDGQIKLGMTFSV